MGQIKTEGLVYRLKNTMDRANSLELEYQGKVKGEAYMRRRLALKNKFEYYLKQIHQLGMGNAITYLVTMKDPITHHRLLCKVTLLDTFTREDVENIVKIRTGLSTIESVQVLQQIELGKVIIQ